jgi:hypothetical protein
MPPMSNEAEVHDIVKGGASSSPDDLRRETTETTEAPKQQVPQPNEPTLDHTSESTTGGASSNDKGIISEPLLRSTFSISPPPSHQPERTETFDDEVQSSRPTTPVIKQDHSTELIHLTSSPVLRPRLYKIFSHRELKRSASPPDLLHSAPAKRVQPSRQQHRKVEPIQISSSSPLSSPEPRKKTLDRGKVKSESVPKILNDDVAPKEDFYPTECKSALWDEDVWWTFA